MTIDLEIRRRLYAEEVCAVAGLDDPALIDAFARVPRERFLGPGPWQVAVVDAMSGAAPYRTTASADPAHLYHNVLIAIDPARQLNNGHPSSLARWIAALGIRPGDRVAHLGCGVGYYTAVMAELAGPSGRVLAIEVEPDLAARAKANLADRATVEVVAGDGSEVPSLDAIFVNAGCTHPRAEWLDALAPGGRALIPLTAHVPRQPSLGGVGGMFRFERGAAGWSAELVTRVGIYDCAGARDEAEEGALLAWAQQSRSDAAPTIRSLVRAPHDKGPGCVIHTGRYCLSSDPP